ncbi:hypothetical protein NJ7G_2117 [Natrinema sp. J7-2]|nr:hypothetical protein NJ7G_2117 [Natrinema sp. J7-2]
MDSWKARIGSETTSRSECDATAVGVVDHLEQLCDFVLAKPDFHVVADLVLLQIMRPNWLHSGQKLPGIEFF